MSFPGFLQGIASFEDSVEAESYFESLEESTTSNSQVTFFQVETSPKTSGDFIILHSAAIKQSQSNKIMIYEVDYRLNATGSWINIISIDYEGRADSFTLQTGLSEITVSDNDTIELRQTIGGTTGGGTASIKNKGFILWQIRTN